MDVENPQSLILRALIFSPTFKYLISALWPSLSWAVDSFRQQGGELMYDVIIQCYFYNATEGQGLKMRYF